MSKITHIEILQAMAAKVYFDSGKSVTMRSKEATAFVDAIAHLNGTGVRTIRAGGQHG